MTQTRHIPQQARAEQWYVIDAKDQVLGRVATRVATLLRGKHESTFSPHVPAKNHVIIVNAAAFRVTGAKMTDKMYYRHSSRPGSLKERTLEEQLERRPLFPLQKAIERMLPDNRLRAIWMNHLHLYESSEHPHAAQQPQEVTL
jgi:large subunit ribosomal protein L13